MASCGRQIVFNVYDDGYNPANSVPQTRRLVEQDKVFAVVGVARHRAWNLAVRPYLNSRKVPQMLNATGATTWGKDQKQYPWTVGWQPPTTSRGAALRSVDRPQQPERQDRGTAPERQLRRGQPRGA